MRGAIVSLDDDDDDDDNNDDDKVYCNAQEEEGLRDFALTDYTGPSQLCFLLQS